MRNSRQIEDVPELMQLIQSQLPVKEAARTSVLSKSWLRAWSTNPTLKFHIRQTKHLKAADHTLNRYLHDNIPIERFDLDILIENQESASIAEKWIRSVATTTCLKELSISTRLIGASLELPDEILSVSKNLTRLKVSSTTGMYSVSMKSSHRPPIINCVSLREVVFRGVHTSQEVLDGILSSCSLLVKLELARCSQTDLKTIKVINLHCLYELSISLELKNATALEISHVPNVRLFTCELGGVRDRRPSKFCSFSLGSSVTELTLGGLIENDESLEMIKSGFPCLESLTLNNMGCWTSGNFNFTSASLKRLSLMRFPENMLIDIQVYAPKLYHFLFSGYTMPSLLFPVSTLYKTTFDLSLDMPVDTSFFLKMREALTLSSKCDVCISINYEWKLGIDLDDLRTRLPFPPAKNVQWLDFQMIGDECMWEHSPFFDAFFEICHPKHVFARPCVHTNHFCKLMLREILEEKKTTRGAIWPRYLKRVQIGLSEDWETLTNSHRGFLDGLAPSITVFKLNWC